MAKNITVRILADSRGFKREVTQVEASLSGLGRSFAGLGAIVGGAALFGNAVRGLAEVDAAATQTAAAIESTGNAANVSAEQQLAYADTLEKLTATEAEVIIQGQNMLRTFTGVRNEVGEGNQVFDRATVAALDLSARGFGSVESASVMLGKALNDPIGGITALGRAGVQFTDEQKELIKTLVESGDTLEAQKIILAEIEKQVGGSAEAFGDSLQGQLQGARLQFEALTEKLVESLLPAMTRLLDIGMGVIDFFMGLPAPVQEAIVITGALGLAYGKLKQPISDAIGLVRGFMDLLNKRRQAESIGAFTNALYGKSNASVTATKSLSGLSLGLGALGGALALGGVAMTIFGQQNAEATARVQAMEQAIRSEASGVEEAINKHIALELVNRGLIDSLSRADISIEEMVAAIRQGPEAVQQLMDKQGVMMFQLEGLRNQTGDLAIAFGAATTKVEEQDEALSHFGGSADYAKSKVIDLEDALRGLEERFAGITTVPIVGQALKGMGDGLGVTTETVRNAPIWTGGGQYGAIVDYMTRTGVPFEVSSGFRPGSITRSGNLSYHALGKAVDMVGDMFSIFRALEPLAKAGYLAELFFDPLGGYKNGQFIGPIGGHSDHVHAAVYHQGVDFVPRTGWAFLEKGEAVIPAHANRGFTASVTGRTTTVNVTINAAPGQSPAGVGAAAIAAVRRELSAAGASL